ncbi:LEA type 2 family protein [Hymenobacter profundi]|uniref:LEA type 2 family protein n=1 Tax=Hymenobacter profundi TaxID=1982110 RepID=A0ABS6X0N9_9BACT|nr:LEA type 2 family protein [Hymenobacter profundi]MBW3128503.1 LEA type 2 family protein [Hymenobacter profundi]MBW3128534.1 LEA type 2 family protein [Hymenobacter profundi]
MLPLPHSTKYRFLLAGLGLLLLLHFTGCGISEQVQQAKAFENAQIRLASVQQATVAGIDIMQIRQLSDLSTVDKARLAAAYAAGNLPLRMLVNLEIRNPNAEMAALNELDYIALIDGKQVAKGRSTQRIEVAPNGGTTLAPITVESNLREALREESGEALADLVLGFADRDRQPVRLTMRVRPTFVTNNGRRITPAGYINLSKEFTASQLIDAIEKRDSLNTRP